MVKKARSAAAAQVAAKAQKPSTYAAVSGLAAGLGPVLAALFPAHTAVILAAASAVGVIAGAVGTFKGVPVEPTTYDGA